MGSIQVRDKNEFSIERAADRDEALSALRQKARELGYELEDLVRSLGSPDEMRNVYVNPESPHQVWNGRGRKPDWFRELLRDGVNPDQLLKKDMP
jgi:DNA-binding protein H-NS